MQVLMRQFRKIIMWCFLLKICVCACNLCCFFFWIGVAHYPPKPNSENSEYLVKWKGLPYCDCTHEDGDLILKYFPEAVEEYKSRHKSLLCPSSKPCKVTIKHFATSTYNTINLINWLHFHTLFMSINITKLKL
jgi:Chromo (CHRromatin Organisation MOdifier) domain